MEQLSLCEGTKQYSHLVLQTMYLNTCSICRPMFFDILWINHYTFQQMASQRYGKRMTSNDIPLLNTTISFLVLKPLHNNPTQQHVHSKNFDLHFPLAQEVLDILITMMHCSSHCYEETSHNTSISNGDSRSQINAPGLLNDPPFETDLCVLHRSTMIVQSNGLTLAHLFQRSMS